MAVVKAACGLFFDFPAANLLKISESAKKRPTFLLFSKKIGIGEILFKFYAGKLAFSVKKIR